MGYKPKLEQFGSPAESGESIDSIKEIATEQQIEDREQRGKDKWISEAHNYQFDPDKEVDDELFNLKVRVNDRIWDIAGPGAIGVIAGPPKARKTAILSAMEAASITNKEVLGFSFDLNASIKPLTGMRRVMSVDTEQKESSFYKVKKNVVGVSDKVHIYDAYWLRSLYPKDRIKFIDANFGDPDKEKPKLLIIDVITDVMRDINDYIESQNTVEWLMKFAGKDTTVITTIHLSKQGMVNGHIGSALAKKLDFLLQIRQDDEDYNLSTCEFLLTRDCPRPPNFTIRQDPQTHRIYRPDLENLVGIESHSLGINKKITHSNVDLTFGSSTFVDTEEEIPF